MVVSCNKCIHQKVRLSNPYWNPVTQEYIHPHIKYDCAKTAKTIKTLNRKKCKDFTSKSQVKL